MSGTGNMPALETKVCGVVVVVVLVVIMSHGRLWPAMQRACSANQHENVPPCFFLIQNMRISFVVQSMKPRKRENKESSSCRSLEGFCRKGR